MKKYLNLSVLLVLTIMLFASCSKNDEVDLRDKFVATYQVEESYVVNGTTYKLSYVLTVTKSAQNQNEILLSNFAKGGASTIVRANVSGTKFTIQQQTVQDTGFSGSGSINGSTLSFSYQQSTSSDLWNVTATGTKM